MNTKNILLVGAALVAAYFIFRKKPLLETAVVKDNDAKVEEDKEPVMDVKPKPVQISGIVL